jgi:hypothetical protein
MELTQRPATPKKGMAEMPSPDLLAAEVLDKKCFSLEHRIKEGKTSTHGLLHMEDIPFVWSLDWEKDKGQLKFHLQVWHVRPRSLKQVVNKHFNLTEGEIL